MTLDRGIVRTFLLILCGIPLACTSARPRGAIVSDHWKVSWSRSGIRAVDRETGRSRDVCTNTAEETLDDGRRTGFWESCRLLSVIGPVVSYEYSWAAEGGAHPTGGSSYDAELLSDDAKHDTDDAPDVGAITALFDERDVVNALVQDPTIAKYRVDYETPTDLPELVEQLDGGCDVAFGALPANFAIVGIGKDDAVVRFGLPYGCEARRGNFTSFDVSIPIPTRSRAWFEAARERHSFNMNPETE